MSPDNPLDQLYGYLNETYRDEPEYEMVFKHCKTSKLFTEVQLDSLQIYKCKIEDYIECIQHICVREHEIAEILYWADTEQMIKDLEADGKAKQIKLPDLDGNESYYTLVPIYLS
ncbi:hypothetical protein [Curvivirga sp.]|uniref:hypothetical protein n=1 Tax=Curvivirga sp. TaxID=2856848 RepID=UPI003B58EDCA